MAGLPQTRPLLRAQANRTSLVRPDGQEIPVELTASPMAGASGAQFGTVLVLRDITEREHAERIQSAVFRISELVHDAGGSEQLYRGIHEIIGQLMPAKNFYIALYDRVNDLLEFPYAIDEEDDDFRPVSPGKTLTAYVLRTGRPLLAPQEVFDELVRAGEVELYGAPSIDWLGVPLTSHGETIGVIVLQSYTPGVRYGEEEMRILEYVSAQIAMAIERVQAEEDRRTLAQRMEAVVETVDDGITLCDTQGVFLVYNSRMREMTGWSADEVRTCHELFGRLDTDTRGDLEGLWQTTVDSRRREIETLICQKSGQQRTILAASSLIRHHGRDLFLCAYHDISERKAAEQQILESETTLKALINATDDFLVLVDRDGCILTLNDAWPKALKVAREGHGRSPCGGLPPQTPARATPANLRRGARHRTGPAVDRRKQRAILGEHHVPRSRPGRDWSRAWRCSAGTLPNASVRPRLSSSNSVSSRC